MGLMHLTKLKIKYIKSFFHYLQEGLPVKLKGMHVLNTVYFIDKIMFLINPFIKKEVLDMVSIFCIIHNYMVLFLVKLLHDE